MKRAALARWLEQHLVPIQEKACRRAEQEARALAAKGFPPGHAGGHDLRARVWLRFVATDVKSAVIPGSGHWLMEEQREATVAVILAFVQAP